MVRDTNILETNMQRRKTNKKSSYPGIKSSVLMSICNNGLLRGGVTIEINLLGWKNDKNKETTEKMRFKIKIENKRMDQI